MHTAHKERAVVVVQFFIFTEVFIEERLACLRVHICHPIREYIQRRSHVIVAVVRTLTGAPPFTLMNLFTRERQPVDATFMKKPSVIA